MIDERKVEAVIIPRSERAKQKEREASGNGIILILCAVVAFLAQTGIIDL